MEDSVRSFEIGVVLATWRSSQDPTTVGWSEIRAMALRAEEIGFDTVWSPDELVGRLVKDGPVYGFWTVSRCPPRWRP
jgi:alkanesulfonate monooxygenase SsuD/methylene tetrahydromethanopterin reductase-like flavin-dependent oxidoreductase (luciferase family)